MGAFSAKHFNTILRKIWYEDQGKNGQKALKMGLRLLSLPYHLAVDVRNRLFDLGVLKQVKLPCKVISVGNITVGGTGKTPMVILLARMLKERGYRPAVLSRGYGGNASSSARIISDGVNIMMTTADVGDEPILIARSLQGIPVLTGPDRVYTGTIALENLDVDILILDDAFQHRRIFRDVDIVLLNREKPLGNGHLLPRGPLREHPRGLNRAHITVWKDTLLTGRFPRYEEQTIGVFQPVISAYLEAKALVRGDLESSLPLGYLENRKVCAFAGIAFPEAYRETIESLGGNIVHFLSFPDHYQYTREDLFYIEKVSEASQAEIIMTTEKDGVRLSNFPNFLRHIYLLQVEMEVLPSRKHFETLIFEKLR